MDIKELSPELENAQPCHESGAQHNIDGAFSCVECYPFGIIGLIF